VFMPETCFTHEHISAAVRQVNVADFVSGLCGRRGNRSRSLVLGKTPARRNSEHDCGKYYRLHEQAGALRAIHNHLADSQEATFKTGPFSNAEMRPKGVTVYQR